jgi:predicted NAD/FAD-dependent oxidoreductase
MLEGARTRPRGHQHTRITCCTTSLFPVRFKAMVDEWVAAGAVREWRGLVGTLQDGCFEALPADGPTRYIATGGMASLAKHLASPVSDFKGPS